MDIDKKAQEIIESSVISLEQINNLLIDGQELIKKILNENKERILECESEEEFLKLLAEIGDRIYKTDSIREIFDGFIFLKIIQVLDKFVFDKIFGNDWFEQLKDWLKNG